jgi:predicted ATP-grasp superfamily ATP-dependent carboligase
VLKPVRGAGSIGVQLVRSSAERQCPPVSGRHDGWILQQFVAGMAVSVAFLCWRSGRHALMPCRQHLSQDGRFLYQGGELPLPDQLADRAERLADAAVGLVLPNVIGYVGVDLVLGNDPAGGGDAVIEINPRVTTSYVGLRVATQDNLAAAMLAVADDRPPDVRFSTDPLQFDADGIVRRAGELGGRS